MVTKAEIKKTLSEIKALDKASQIVITDYDLRDGLYLKMASKMDVLIRRIIEERELSDFCEKELKESLKEIRSHIKTIDDYEKAIYCGEEYDLSADINIAVMKIQALVVTN